VTILVLFGLHAEWAPWRRHHAFRRLNAENPAVYETEIQGSLVRAGVVGMGAARMPDLPNLWRAGVDLVVVSGLAGSLRAEHDRLKVIVANEVRSPKRQTAIAGAQVAVAAAVRRGARQVSTLLTVERVVGSAADKALLAAEGDAVDMESFVVLSEAVRHGVEGVAIRVIGDAADEDLPIDFSGALRPGGTIDPARMLLNIASRPHKWPAFVLFALRQWRALRQLARFLDEFIGEYSSRDYQAR
jgi:nucleoside phosphorylase